MYRFLIVCHFEKQLKRLAKKDLGLKDNVIELLENFDLRNAVNLGRKIYKIRLARERRVNRVDIE